MNTQTTYLEKPNLVNVIAWTTLASGIVNLGWGLAASAVALISIVGICCTPFTILPSILGIFEIIYAAKLLSNPPQAVRPATNIAILEIVCILSGNVFSMIVGIISLIFYNDLTVKDYFARLNGDLPSEPVPPAVQVPPVVPVSPVPAEEPIPSPLTGKEPEPPVSPSSTSETVVSSVTRDGEPASLEETTIIEPEAPIPPDASALADQTLISSVRRDGVSEEPEPPAAPDDSDPSRKPSEE
jgi:hypothetical protein